MKKNVLFIYRGQVMKTEFLPEYEKYSEDNCVLLVEKDKTYHLLKLMINRLGLSVILMTHDDLLEDKIKMEFDVIVMNPPYKGGLHIDMFNKSFDLLKDGGKMTCIHPSTPFITRKLTKKDSKTKQIQKIVSEYKTKFIFIDGNKLFNAGFFAPLSITTVEKTKSNEIEVLYKHIEDDNNEIFTYESLNEIFIHGNSLVSNIHKKIIDKMESSLDSKLTRRGSRGNLYLKINSIVGNIPKNGKVNPDFYCLIYREKQNSFDELISDTFIGGDTMYVAIENEGQGINLFNYCLTKFARFCVSLYKINQHIDRGELTAVPFLDFNNEWTEETLYEYFGLTEEEINFINDYIGNWYERDFV
jgi:hypothetical protein